MARHNVIGKSGEDLAVEWLEAHGYPILTRNFLCKIGEIDIVAKDRDQIVFVEVKTRSSTLFGTPAQSITSKKLHLLIQTAEYYLSINKLRRNYRIDAIEVFLTEGKPAITHIENITF